SNAFSLGQGEPAPSYNAGGLDPSTWNGDIATTYIGDFDGDGQSDLLRVEKGGAPAQNDSRAQIQVFLASPKADGSFNYGPHDSNDNGSGLSAQWNGDVTRVIVADVDGDGKSDIIRQEYGTWAFGDNHNSIQVYLAQSDASGTFTGFALGPTDDNTYHNAKGT